MFRLTLFAFRQYLYLKNNKMDLNEILNKSESMSDIARFIFGKPNYTNREKCKKILTDNGVDWNLWVESKRKYHKYCLNCGREINGNDKKRRKFCSHACSASFNNPQRLKKNTTCKNCGKELSGRQKVFCSIECQNDYEYKQYIEKWKNGEVICDTCEVSRHIRRYLFDKNNGKCQLCGWGEENPVTHRIPLQIHHVDGDCTNNDEVNLQLLCPNCHSLTETYGKLNEGSSRRKKRHMDE